MDANEEYSATDDLGIAWHVLDRYIAGDASPADLDAVARWATNAENAAFLQVLRDPDARGAIRRTRKVDERWSAIASGMELSDIAERVPVNNREYLSKTHIARKWGALTKGTATRPFSLRRMAAAIAGVSALAGAAFWWNTSGSLDFFRTRTSTMAIRTIVTLNGQRSIVTLVDGTKVLLNSGSQLRIIPDRRMGQIVELQGEALFTVTHQNTRPFIVQAGAARVTVLGTTFAIRRYPEDGRARVVVVEGRVAMHPARKSSEYGVVLGARSLGEVADSGQPVIVIPNVDVDQYTDWTRGQLVFHGTPLREVLPELQRRYGLVIRLANASLADQRLTATLADDPPNVILDFITKTLGMRYTREGNTVTFFQAQAEEPKSRESFIRSVGVSYGK